MSERMSRVVMDDVLLEELGTAVVSAASLADILVLVSDEGIMPAMFVVGCSEELQVVAVQVQVTTDNF